MKNPINSTIQAKWVCEFNISAVLGNSDEVHNEFAKLGNLIFEHLALGDKKFADDYRDNLEDYKLANLELDKSALQLERTRSHFGFIQKKFEITSEIKSFLEAIENANQNYQDHKQDLKLLYKKYKLFYRDFKTLENEDNEEEVFNLLTAIKSDKASLQLKLLLLKNKKNEAESYYNSVKNKVDELQNNIKNIQENILKEIEKEAIITQETDFRDLSGRQFKETFRTRINAKEINKNFVFANISFIVERNFQKFEISIPIKFSDKATANLLPYAVEDKVLIAIRGLYIKGLELLGHRVNKDSKEMQLTSYKNDNFATGEQTLFFALLKKQILRQQLAKKLMAKVDNNLPHKLVAIALDVYTPRYISDYSLTSATGFLDNSKDKSSFKNLMIEAIEQELKSELGFENNFIIDKDIKIIMRFSASNELGVRKTLYHHQNLTDFNNSQIFQKDLRIDSEKPDFEIPQTGKSKFNEMLLLNSLQEHSIFISCDVSAKQKFQNSYEMTIKTLTEKSALLDDSARKIQNCFRVSSAKKLEKLFVGNSADTIEL